MSNFYTFSFAKVSYQYATGWLILVGVQTLVLHRLQLSWQVSFTDSLISGTLLALAGFSTSMVYRFYQPGRSNRIYRLLFALALAAFIVMALRKSLSCIFSDDPVYLNFLQQSEPVRFVFALLIISFIGLLNWMVNMLMDQKDMEQRKQENEQLVKEAELTKLRQQLQPHFLFNSLNSINALIGSKPVEARKMTQQLSDFLRGTLKKEDNLVKLIEELDHLKLYLDIEKVRFGHRLQVEFSTSDESLNSQLPALLLQPIVENAIKFGLYDSLDEVVITISSAVTSGFLQIEITNPFDEETNAASKGMGFGLQSITRRLQLLYARQDLLSTTKGSGIFKTTLKIPIS